MPVYIHKYLPVLVDLS